MNKKKELLVTIMIPAYNGSKYIEETILSVLHQTHTNLELLITDDASIDNTIDIIKSIKDPRIKLYQNKQNLGLAKNINTMLHNAAGDFCIVLGQDDIFQPNHLYCMLKQFIQSEVNLVHCNASLIDEKGENLGILLCDDQKQILHNRNPLKVLAFKNYIQSCGMMFRSDAFLKTGGWDEKYHIYGEWLWYIKMAKIGTFGYCNETLSSYRKHSSSTNHIIKKEKTLNFTLYKMRCRFLAFKYLSLPAKEILSFYKGFLLTTLKSFRKLILLFIKLKSLKIKKLLIKCFR